MNKKRLIGWGVGVLLALSVIMVAFVASSVGGEASKVKGLLDQDISTHAAKDAIKQQLTALNYDFGSAADGPELTGKGPKHSAVLYGTWLTVKISFDPEGKAHAYDLERASSWF